MKVKFKFEGIDERGFRVSIIKAFDYAPDFKDDKPFMFSNQWFPGETKEQKLMNWMDEQDKRLFMDENHIYIILNYEVYKPRKKAKKVSLHDLIKEHITDPKMALDIVAAYGEMKDVIKGLSPSKQLNILLKSIGVGYKAQIAAYDHMIGIHRGENEEFNERLAKRLEDTFKDSTHQLNSKS